MAEGWEGKEIKRIFRNYSGKQSEKRIRVSVMLFLHFRFRKQIEYMERLRRMFLVAELFKDLSEFPESR